jgi:hypothetical protein
MSGVIDGIVRSEDDGSPVPFALIRLQPDSGQTQQSGAAQQRITSAEGRFRFASVSPGSYRIQLLRIGYRPVLSATVTVVAGETLRHEMSAPTRAVQLPPVLVRADDACLTGERLTEDGAIATLWNEAQKGVNTRRVFDLTYRYVRTVRQEGEVAWRFRGKRPLRRLDTLVNEPDSVVARDARQRATHRDDGYGTGGLLSVPNEKELLDDEFLREHCLEAPVQATDGLLGLRFRRVEPRGDATAIRGTIWVDAETYLMHRLDVEWLRGTDRVGEGRIDYADVEIDGRSFRLPARGTASVRVRGVQRTVVTGATANITFSYRDFAAVRPE